MKLWVVLSIVISSLSVIYGQFQSCATIMTLDCTTFPDTPECATNGVTYINRCAFGKVHCNNTSIHIVSSGHCHSAPSMTLTPLLPGADAILDFFCTQLSHLNCPLTADEMCGTDGKTYRNGEEKQTTRSYDLIKLTMKKNRICGRPFEFVKMRIRETTLYTQNPTFGLCRILQSLNISRYCFSQELFKFIEYDTVVICAAFLRCH